MRDELLNESLFFGLDHARELIASWVEDYNTARPHSSLGYQTPEAFSHALRTARDHHAAQRAGSARWPLAPVAPHGVSPAEALNATSGNFSGRSPPRMRVPRDAIDVFRPCGPKTFAIPIPFRSDFGASQLRACPEDGEWSLGGEPSRAGRQTNPDLLWVSGHSLERADKPFSKDGVD
jgi:hypothetical protein